MYSNNTQKMVHILRILMIFFIFKSFFEWFLWMPFLFNFLIRKNDIKLHSHLSSIILCVPDMCKFPSRRIVKFGHQNLQMTLISKFLANFVIININLYTMVLQGFQAHITFSKFPHINVNQSTKWSLINLRSNFWKQHVQNYSPFWDRAH